MTPSGDALTMRRVNPTQPPPPFELQTSPWNRARERLADPATVGLLPVGAVEAHGPHLPLFTDVYLSRELCHRVALALVDTAACPVILPDVTLSVTEYSASFAGTLSLRRTTAVALYEDLFASLARHGLRRVALINSHLEPAHVEVLQDVASRAPAGLRALFVNHCRKPWALELGDEFRSGDCHAGEFETSLLLASRYADQVDMPAASALPDAPHGLVAQMKAGVRTFEAMGATQAYFGHPRTATRAEGERLWSVLTRMWTQTILADLTTTQPGMT